MVNGIFSSVRDLGSTLVLIAFCMTVFGVFSNSLLSGILRYRCYDTEAAEYLKLFIWGGAGFSGTDILVEGNFDSKS